MNNKNNYKWNGEAVIHVIVDWYCPYGDKSVDISGINADTGEEIEFLIGGYKDNYTQDKIREDLKYLEVGDTIEVYTSNFRNHLASGRDRYQVSFDSAKIIKMTEILTPPTNILKWKDNKTGLVHLNNGKSLCQDRFETVCGIKSSEETSNNYTEVFAPATCPECIKIYSEKNKRN